MGLRACCVLAAAACAAGLPAPAPAAHLWREAELVLQRYLLASRQRLEVHLVARRGRGRHATRCTRGHAQVSETACVACACVRGRAAQCSSTRRRCRCGWRMRRVRLWLRALQPPPSSGPQQRPPGAAAPRTECEKFWMYMLKSMGELSDATTAVRLYGLLLSLWALITAVICRQQRRAQAPARRRSRPDLRPRYTTTAHHIARGELFRGVLGEVDGSGERPGRRQVAQQLAGLRRCACGMQERTVPAQRQAAVADGCGGASCCQDSGAHLRAGPPAPAGTPVCV